MVGRVLRPVEPQRLAQLGVGAGQLRPRRRRASGRARRARPRRSARTGGRSGRRSPRGAPISSSSARRLPGLGPRLGPQQIVDHRLELGEARLQQLDELARASCPARCSAAGRRCGAGAPVEACSNRASRTSSGTSAVSISAQSASIRNSRSAARKAAAAWPKAAPSSSVSEKGATMPSRLTKRLATLVAMISLLQPVGEDGVAVPLLHRLGEGAAAARATSVGSSVKFAASIAACSRILAVDSSTASSGRVRPRLCLGAAEQLLVAVRAPRPRG